MTTETIPLTQGGDIIEKLAAVLEQIEEDRVAAPMRARPLYSEFRAQQVRAVLQTLHDNITPEMARAAADEVNGELPALAMRGAIQEAIATALKGERA